MAGCLNWMNISKKNDQSTDLFRSWPNSAASDIPQCWTMQGFRKNFLNARHPVWSRFCLHKNNSWNNNNNNNKRHANIAGGVFSINQYLTENNNNNNDNENMRKEIFCKKVAKQLIVVYYVWAHNRMHQGDYPLRGRMHRLQWVFLSSHILPADHSMSTIPVYL